MVGPLCKTQYASILQIHSLQWRVRWFTGLHHAQHLICMTFNAHYRMDWVLTDRVSLPCYGTCGQPCCLSKACKSLLLAHMPQIPMMDWSSASLSEAIAEGELNWHKLQTFTCWVVLWLYDARALRCVASLGWMIAETIAMTQKVLVQAELRMHVTEMKCMIQ